MIPTVVVSPRGAERLEGGHPWVYRGDVVNVRADGGDVVSVRDERGRLIGSALFSSRSQIALRLLERDTVLAGADVAQLLQRRIAAAVSFRQSLDLEATAYRLVHGEADQLPSLIVDRYGDVLVVQTLSQGMDRRLPLIVEALEGQLEPRGILARNDPRTRVLEGLDQRVEVLAGEVPDLLEVTEHGVRYEVSLRGGQKTGLFLDQRENRRAALQYARGRLLDCFSYDGGFALTLAGRAAETVAIEVAEAAVGRLRGNAARNHLTIDARVGNVFDELRGLDRLRERFDTIVLDPPAFAKARKNLETAMRGYKELNLRALKMLRPGGTLVTCSCSYHLGESEFVEVVADAARDAHRTVRLVEKRGAAKDHPVVLGVPETSYLKCLIMSVSN